MARDARTRSQSVGARRFGYAVAVLINAVMLFLINAWPGWQAVGVLTDETERVLTPVNASIIAGVVANVMYLVYDARWFKALGDLITTVIGLYAVVRIWQVFPFDFGDATFDWELLVRILLIVAIVGSAIAIIVHVVNLIRALVAR